MYLEYTEYQKLGGKLDSITFEVLEYDARSKVDNLTFGRLKELEEQTSDVKMCIYRLIETINEGSSILESESVDGYSVKYKNTAELINTTTSLIEDYLGESYLKDGTPYLYRGV